VGVVVVVVVVVVEVVVVVRFGAILCSDGQKLTKKLITNSLIYLF